jgi:alcohol dehydrogenase class IV
MGYRLGEFGIDPASFQVIAGDAVADEVIVNAPRRPTEAEVVAMLAAAGE